MPKKGKKGKGGGKGGGKTEGERLLQLQQRAQAEEEMAKKKEEMLTQFLKDKLQKEEKNTAMNVLKLNEVWRAILRQTRAVELNKAITVLSQTFERQLNDLDSIIKNLEHELMLAEHQSAQAQRVHLQHVDHLLAQQDRRLVFVQQQWESGLQDLTSRFICERKQMFANSQQHQAELDNVTFAVEKQAETVMNETHRLYRDIITSYESTYNNRKAEMPQADKEKMRENQKAMQVFTKETKKFNQLVSKNQEFIQKNDEDIKRVKRLQDLVIRLRELLHSKKTEDEPVEQDLRVSRNRVQAKTQEFREQLTQAQGVAREQFTSLTLQSDQATKKLQTVITKGERALSVAKICHKLESSVTLFHPEDGADRSRPDIAEPAKNISEDPELQQVMENINAAVLQREALKKHKEDLHRENQQLKLLMSQHLDAMTVNKNTINGPHPLLTVNTAPTTTSRSETNKHRTIIEAVHAVRH